MFTKWVMSVVVLLTLTAVAAGGPITARGSDSTQDVVKALATAYQAASGNVVNVEGGGWGKGAKDCLAGAVDVAVLSRDLNDSEKVAGLVGFPYALDGVAILVNKANPVDDLTLAQLCDLFAGKTTTWASGQPVLVFTRPEGSGTRECFTNVVMGKEALSPAAVVKHEKAIDATVAKAVTAIAYNSAGAVAADPNVKVVKVAGMAPTHEAIRAKTYPICRTLTLATKGQPAPAVQAFIDFVLSPVGQKVVAEAGYVTLAEGK